MKVKLIWKIWEIFQCLKDIYQMKIMCHCHIRHIYKIEIISWLFPSQRCGINNDDCNDIDERSIKLSFRVLSFGIFSCHPSPPSSFWQYQHFGNILHWHPSLRSNYSAASFNHKRCSKAHSVKRVHFTDLLLNLISQSCSVTVILLQFLTSRWSGVANLQYLISVPARTLNWTKYHRSRHRSILHYLLTKNEKGGIEEATIHTVK